MKYVLLSMLWALSLVAADKLPGPIGACNHDHGGVQAGDTDCPGYRNGLKCYGFGMMDGLTLNGPRYRCTICGVRWIVTTERQPARRSPTDCPGFLNGGNGLKCIGFGMIDGITVNGTRYKCGLCGCRWIVR
jgi:hypothetical protein